MPFSYQKAPVLKDALFIRLDSASDEETPLLQKKKVRGRTPLPKFQIGIVLLLQICEPLTSQSIYPYINQLVSELGITGGDEGKVGYYAGLIESIFFAAEALTVLQWSRISDHVGRKPVLLIGMLGTVISMLMFGLSKTFWGLVISRSLTGLLNGNIGVMKSVMGELTDSTNRAEGYAYMPVVWATGATLGPLMGGTLSRPHEQFPKLFGAPFWREYPYFLPCVATSSFVVLSILVTLCFFKETLPRRRPSRKRVSSDASRETLLNGDVSSRQRDDGPLALREILIYPVIVSVSNYVSLAFLNICLGALIPLFFAMPIEIGGLGLSPAQIGATMGMYGAGCGVFQAFFFARTVRYFGERTVFVCGICAFIPAFTMFPIISLAAKQHGLCYTVWILTAVLLAMLAIMDMAYGCIAMYITTSAPRNALGATNGLSQSVVSVARAIGPALSTSLFSWSVEKGILGGYGVYAILTVVSFFSLWLATRLPAELWPEEETEDDD
ncbi:major facilitator superfamily domain-containing protein [Coprinopsis sp. MPI-PUGE-AT-0042]|nr:major facilitator superfamily domain-containing protein [Coprinopsis sp. MPI-PUGE-AT-0042]